MGLSIYFQSIDTMHPALAYEISQQFLRLHAKYTWLSCDVQPPEQSKDGFLSGTISPEFPTDETLPGDSGFGGEGGLMTMIQILAILSREHAVDWEVSHDYEPDAIGRIVEGDVGPKLIEELEAVVNIGNLFGDFMDEEDSWGDESDDTEVWQPAIEQPQLRIADEDEIPRVLKFPGTE